MYLPVEAETFNAAHQATNHGSMVGLRSGSWLRFDRLDFGAAKPPMVQAIAAVGSRGVSLTYRLDSPTGPVIAQTNLGSTNGWQNTIKAQADLATTPGITGVHDVYVTVTAPDTNEALRLDRFQFKHPAFPLAGADSGAKPLFVVHCGFSHRRMDDPIVHPGKPGAAHSHDFFGATTTHAGSTEESLRNSSTTCSNPADTASYWAPSVYDPQGNAVTPFNLKVYYQVVNGPTAGVIAPPADLRMISGDPNTTKANAGFLPASWRCAFGGEQRAVPGTSVHEMAVCPPGHNLQVNIMFQDCWNGKDLDSPDHRSHMAYSSGGRCPSTHPVKIVTIHEIFEYATQGGVGYTLASGDALTMHADFWNTWDQAKLEELVQVCIIEQRHGCDPAPYVQPSGPKPTATLPPLFGLDGSRKEHNNHAGHQMPMMSGR